MSPQTWLVVRPTRAGSGAFTMETLEPRVRFQFFRWMEGGEGRDGWMTGQLGGWAEPRFCTAEG